MNRAALLLMFGLLTLAFAATAGAGSWRVIGTAKASGDFAVAAANGSAKRPKQLAIRITNSRNGKVTGMAVVSCSKGFGIGSKSSQYSGRSPLFKVLPIPMRNSDSCDVVASGSSMAGGILKVQILVQ